MLLLLLLLILLLPLSAAASFSLIASESSSAPTTCRILYFPFRRCDFSSFSFRAPPAPFAKGERRPATSFGRRRESVLCGLTLIWLTPLLAFLGNLLESTVLPRAPSSPLSPLCLSLSLFSVPSSLFFSLSRLSLSYLGIGFCLYLLSSLSPHYRTVVKKRWK